MMYGKFCTSIIALLAIATQTRADDDSSQENAQIASGSYCGIYSIHRAFASLGSDLSIGSLVQPKYIGSRLGSSLQELQQAATDFGFESTPVSHASAIMLYDVRNPFILHTKSEHGLSDFDHWVLFMGIEGNQARICDGIHPMRLVNLKELAELWDGNGLIISKAPINRYHLYTSSYFLFLLYAISGYAIYLLLKSLNNFLKILTHRGFIIRNKIFIESLVILLISLLLPIAFSMTTPSGFLSSSNAIKGIQSKFVFSNYRDISYEEFKELLSNGAVTVIDARLTYDFELGHIPGSINIPPNLSIEKALAKLSQKPKDSHIILYCQSNGCPFSKTVGEKLSSAGFTNMEIYKNGWLDWQSHSR